jgi:hypothetical protein
MPTVFSSTHYYILSLGEMSMEPSALIQATQSAGYTIILYEGSEASVYRQGELAVADLQSALADTSVVLVDGSQFYLRQANEPYTFTVRPSGSGYELIISPQQELPINDTLTSILIALQEIGILGNDVNLDFASFAKADLKGPASPAGVRIDSTLYGLTVAEDWFAYASAKGLIQQGLRVEVIAEKVPGGVLDSQYVEYVSEETETLVKLLIPINNLVALASSSPIGYVRIAYQPVVP